MRKKLSVGLTWAHKSISGETAKREEIEILSRRNHFLRLHLASERKKDEREETGAARGVQVTHLLRGKVKPRLGGAT